MHLFSTQKAWFHPHKSIARLKKLLTLFVSLMLLSNQAVFAWGSWNYSRCDLEVAELQGLAENEQVSLGEHLDIQAIIQGQNEVGKVKFYLKNSHGDILYTHTEHRLPYYYLGDNNGQPNGWLVDDLESGGYWMKVKVYNQRDRKCDTLEIPFTVVAQAETPCDLTISELSGFPERITTDSVLDIQALTSGQDSIGKVVFQLQNDQGGILKTHTENHSPYYYLGDQNGQPRGWPVDVDPGTYKMAASIYDTEGAVCHDFAPSAFTVAASDSDEGFGASCKVDGVALNVVGKLIFPIEFDTPTVTAVVRNNSAVEQIVNLVSYKEYYPHSNYAHILDDAGNIVKSGQTVHGRTDSETDPGIVVPAYSDINLEIPLPGCSTQIDLVCGPVIDYLGDELYGARKLAWHHAHEKVGDSTQWCATAPPDICEYIESQTRALYTNGEIEIGEVQVDINVITQMTTVTYNITEPGWCLTQTSLSSDSEPLNNTHEDLGCVQSDSYEIAHSECGYILAQAMVTQWSLPVGGQVDSYMVSRGENRTAYFDSQVKINSTDEWQDYPAWCIQRGVSINQDFVYEGCQVFSSLDSNVPVDKPENLDLVNYVLNNWVGTYSIGTTQSAIWSLIDDNPPDPSVNSQTIVDDAMANGEGFTPGPGDVIGMIVHCDEKAQVTLVVMNVDDVNLENEQASAEFECCVQ